MLSRKLQREIPHFCKCLQRSFYAGEMSLQTYQSLPEPVGGQTPVKAGQTPIKTGQIPVKDGHFLPEKSKL